MAIVVEDGTGLVNADSYLSVTDANTYHTNMGNTAWTGTDAVKEVALKKATFYLDYTYQFVGTISSLTQALSWPRDGATDGEDRDLDDSVPQKIKNATAELALIALSSTLVANTSSADYIKREKVGPIETEYKDGAPASTQYNYVNRIIKDLYVSKSGGSQVGVIRA